MKSNELSMTIEFKLSNTILSEDELSIQVLAGLEELMSTAPSLFEIEYFLVDSKFTSK